MKFIIMVLPGDGVGPEVVAEAVKALNAVAERSQHCFVYAYDDVGGAAIDKHGLALRPETLEKAIATDAVLLGAVGGPKWDDPTASIRPEQALLRLRQGLGLFANLRPVKIFPQLDRASPLKPELLQGVDVLVVRELTGGLYYGKPQRQWATLRGRRAVDTMRYTEQEISRILRVAFEAASSRRKKLTVVDKANVLATSRLWREIAMELSSAYPEVITDHMLVDNAAMQLILRPRQFDVLVTENTFGDILTDEAAVLTASPGVLPSASLAGAPSRSNAREERVLGMYEPIHGSAPDIAGQGIANPLATILSASLMLRYSLGLFEEGAWIEKAVEQTIADGYRTADILCPGEAAVSTEQMGNAVAARIIDH